MHADGSFRSQARKLCRRIGHRRIGHWVAFVILGLLGATTSLAQGFSAAEPPITRSDLTAITACLNLSPDQLAAVEALHEGFLEALRTRTEPFRELELKQRQAAEARAADAPEQAALLQSAAREFFRDRQQLRDHFVRDVQAVLTKQQLEDLWPDAERTMRRASLRRLGAYGMTAWPRVDLERSIRALRLSADDQHKADAVVSAWSLEVDGPLRDRERYWTEFNRWSLEQQHAESAHAEEQEHSIVKRVAQINRRFTRQAIAVLPDTPAARLDSAIKAAVYPLFAQPRAGRDCLNQATELPGLDHNQRQQLAALRDAYERESASLDLEVVRRSDSAEQDLENFNKTPEDERNALAREGKDLRNLIYAEFASRRDQLETKTLSAVRAALTPLQRSSVKTLQTPQ